jgi:hypothetical protein
MTWLRGGPAANTIIHKFTLNSHSAAFLDMCPWE